MTQRRLNKQQPAWSGSSGGSPWPARDFFLSSLSRSKGIYTSQIEPGLLCVVATSDRVSGQLV